MPEFSDYHLFIWGAYAVTAVGLIGLVICTAMSLRNSNQRLKALKDRA